MLVLCLAIYIYIYTYIFAAKNQEPKNKSQGPGKRSWAVALISEFTNQNACEFNVYIVAHFRPHQPNCDTGPRAKDQESRSRTQGPCREPRTCSACMGIEPCRGQEPRTKEPESHGPWQEPMTMQEPRITLGSK